MEPASFFEPLELMELAVVLKKDGNEVEIIDMILEKKPLEHFKRNNLNIYILL